MECYVPGVDRPAVEAVAARARAVAAEMAGEGRGVEYVDALLVAGDDAVFHVYRAPDVEAVREAGERAGLPFERVVESIAIHGRWPVETAASGIAP